MNISVIIATYNRATDIEAALESIFKQTLLPKEVIIVDDSEGTATQRVIERLAPSAPVEVIYLKNSGEKSLSITRNVGVLASTGEIVSFIDDDVILHANYYAEIAAVFGSRPEINGVQGFWGSSARRTLGQRVINAFSSAFRHFHYEKTRCRVLYSGNTTYPLSPPATIPCQWLSGCNQTYRKEVFSQFQFDENLLGAAFGEDVDLSYRIWTAHPGSLCLVSSARLVHNSSSEARTPARRAVLLKAAYSHYLHHKKFGASARAQFAFIYGRIGELLLSAGACAVPLGRTRSDRIHHLRYWLAAQLVVFAHRQEIRRGNFSFMASPHKDDRGEKSK